MADGSCVGSSGSTSVLVTTVGSDKPGSSQGFVPLTGKSLSEALIFASTNQQYDNRLFIVHENCKLNTCRTCCVHKLLFLFWHSEQFWYTTCSEDVASFYFSVLTVLAK